MLLRLLRPWNGFDPGRELDFGPRGFDAPGLAAELVRTGVAERAAPPAAASDAPPDPPKPKGRRGCAPA